MVNLLLLWSKSSKLPLRQWNSCPLTLLQRKFPAISTPANLSTPAAALYATFYVFSSSQNWLFLFRVWNILWFLSAFSLQFSGFARFHLSLKSVIARIFWFFVFAGMFLSHFSATAFSMNLLSLWSLIFFRNKFRFCNRPLVFGTLQPNFNPVTSFLPQTLIQNL